MVTLRHSTRSKPPAGAGSRTRLWRRSSTSSVTSGRSRWPPRPSGTKKRASRSLLTWASEREPYVAARAVVSAACDRSVARTWTSQPAGQQLPEQHRDRVRLLAGGAPSAPHPQPAAGPLGVADQLGEHPPLQRQHLRGIAEEVRLLDGHLVEQLLPLDGFRQPAEVLRRTGGAGGPASLPDRVVERVASGVVEDQPRRALQQHLQPAEGVVVEHGPRILQRTPHAVTRPSALSTAGAISGSGS
jgi:hypothetical protein